MDKKIVVSYGAGTNSTAMLVLMVKENILPDLILFADTGGEKPHTYSYITTLNNWLMSHGFPQITVVKKTYRDGTVANLYDHSYERNMLPSLAYGFKNCSQKFKIGPQDKYCNNYLPFKQHWKNKNKVEKWMGYDADEERRVTNARIHEANDKKYTYHYPLYERDLDRDDCIDLIKSAGLPLPGKSACYFCPASTLKDIKQLAENYPDLLDKALELEKNADLHSVKGLGRRFAWADVIEQGDLFQGYGRDWDLPCGCYDGGSDDE